MPVIVYCYRLLVFYGQVSVSVLRFASFLLFGYIVLKEILTRRIFIVAVPDDLNCFIFKNLSYYKKSELMALDVKPFNCCLDENYTLNAYNR